MKLLDENQFEFEKHPAKKGMCPKCRHKDTFRFYEGLPRNYGKCERINECGYFANPYDEPKEIQDELRGKVAVLPPPEKLKTIYVKAEQVQGMISNQTSNFHLYLVALDLVTPNHLSIWNIGTDQYGNTCFVLSDKKKIYNVKTIKYGDNAKRDKTKFPFYLKAPKGQKYSRCLYGAHLLSEDKTICLVESEKTSVLAAAHYPQFDWLATGGANSLTEATIKPLKGRKIYYLPDADKAGRENATIRRLGAFKLDYEIVDLFPERNDGTDLADYLLNEYLENRVLPEIKVPKKEKKEPRKPSIYQLPEEIKIPIEELQPTIEKYRMFQANNKVWIMNEKTLPHTFYPITNFEIKIIQHMQDEKYPKKLIWMKNVYGQEVIYDVLSQEINTPMAFENMVTNHGKFYFTGNRKDHQVLKIYLFEQMGTGRMIETLGWQSEGFWVWNNQVNVPGETTEKSQVIAIDENGVFKYKETSYYVPSANRIYLNNPYKFEAQKKVVCYPSKVTFLEYTTQMLKVHREHAIMGILFAVSSMFQDVVVPHVDGFPMLFLYGPASSGKDQLVKCIQSFFGVPQTGINLESNVSTVKAQVREFAQFTNLVSHLSEYKNGNEQLDGVLKGLWGRLGYKRGTLDSNVSTDSVPVLSSALVTGNFEPTQEALVTRLVWNFMDKTIFSDDEVKEYERLADMTNGRISGLSVVFLNNRHLVEEKFPRIFREFKATIMARKPETNSRMVSNLSVLGSFYQLFNDIVSFPFNMETMLSHFYDIIDNQMTKLNSASCITKFWECYLAAMRTGQPMEQLQINRDYKIDGNKMYFNFTNAYNRIQRQWYAQYKEGAPSKTIMANELKSDRCFIEILKGTRMSQGRQGISTSAYVVNLAEIAVGNEILSNMEFNSADSVGTNNGWLELISSKNSKDKEVQQETLPF